MNGIVANRTGVIAGPSEVWLASRAFDLAVILGGGLLISFVVYFAAESHSTFLPIAVLFLICADFPHVFQTYLRVVLDPDEFAVYRSEFLWSLVAIALLVGSLAAAGELATLVMIWVYWQPFHVIKQHDGMVGVYAAKAGVRRNRTIAKVTLFAGCAAPILYRMAYADFRFGDYRIFDWTPPLSGMSVPVPPVPPAVVILAYLLFATAGLAFIVQEHRFRAVKRALPFPAIANIVVAVASYNFAYLLVADLFAVILIATAIHSFQYHTLCYVRNRRKFSASGVQTGRGRLLAMLSEPRRLPRLAALLITLGAICTLIEPFAYAIPLTLVLHHFYLDGVIWKGAHNPTLARDLGLSRGATKLATGA